MPENSQESQALEGGTQTEETSREGDRQSMLLKLAERTVLQAEALAQEITEHARQESEAEGAKILAEYTERAEVEARQAIEFAQSRSETILSEAAAEAKAESEKTTKKARAESERTLAKAKADSEKVTSDARAESEAMLSKARSESDADLGNAQSQAREILGRARDEALATISTSQARADSAESSARLNAEFIIRQTSQNVSDGIRTAVLEICNNLLPTVEEIGIGALAAPATDQVDIASAIETEILGNGASNPEDSEKAQENIQTSDRPTGKKARSSTKSSGSS